MALNWVTLSEDGKTPIPLENERFFFCQGGVGFEFSSGTGYPGNSEFYAAPQGVLFLTNLRAVFLSTPPTPLVKSLSVPISNLKNCEIVQPFFGANYCKADLEPVNGGGLRNPGVVKFSFKEGGGFSFLALYKQLVQRREELGDNPDHLEALPLYEPPPPTFNVTPTTTTGPPSSTPSSRDPSTSGGNAPPPPGPDDLPPSYDAVTAPPLPPA